VTPRPALDREIFRLAVPALGALAADPLVTLVDTAFVGRIGAEELAALGVAGAVFAIAFTVFNFLAYGTTPLVASALGAADDERAASTAGAAVRLALIAGLGATVVVVTLAGPLLDAMGANPEVRAAALPYLRIRALALPAVLLVMVGHGVFRGHQDTKTPLVVTLALNAVNIVLDPIFIFGFDWGLPGAAWATVIAQGSGAVAFLWLMYSVDGNPVRVGGADRASMRPLMSAGGALIVRTVALIGVLTVTTAVAARLGTVPLAAHQVAVNVWVFFALVVDALAIAGQSLIGKALGAADTPGARAVANRLLWFGLLFGLALGVAIWALRTTIPGWLTDESEVIRAVVTVMPFVAVMQPLNALVFVWDGVAIGAAEFRFLATLMVVAAAAAGLGLGVLALVGGTLVGLWWVIVAWMFVRAAGFVWWHQRGPLSHGRGRSLSSPAG
jgi:putative MATE family efflux protein